MAKGLENKTYRERLREQGLFILKRSRPREVLMIYSSLAGGTGQA